MNSRQLYKHLLRQCDHLTPGAAEYYKFTIKQSFKQHVTETDPQRITQIVDKALKDAEWVLQKYKRK